MLKIWYGEPNGHDKRLDPLIEGKENVVVSFISLPTKKSYMSDNWWLPPPPLLQIFLSKCFFKNDHFFVLRIHHSHICSRVLVSYLYLCTLMKVVNINADFFSIVMLMSGRCLLLCCLWAGLLVELDRVEVASGAALNTSAYNLPNRSVDSNRQF